MNEHKLVEALKAIRSMSHGGNSDIYQIAGQALAEYEAHSKSEYKRLKALGVDVVEPPTAATEG